MTAVAVWDRRPTPRQLLDARLAAGWRPTPTDLRMGPRVLGYAACVFSQPDLGAPSAVTRDQTREDR
ncbi:MAG: hypothetical protein OER21_16225 [Gemmatimonadota bacterium]|nr:hypothetical protein [Gemmatimonadota bacterium]